MSNTLSIGDFSLIIHLSIKTLRYYHQIGLLEPAEVDPHTGYRSYRVEQIPTAQIIQRFRDLNMPLDEVKAVLAAPDLDTRNALIAAHLSRLEGELEQTRQAVPKQRVIIGQHEARARLAHYASQDDATTGASGGGPPGPKQDRASDCRCRSRIPPRGA